MLDPGSVPPQAHFTQRPIQRSRHALRNIVRPETPTHQPGGPPGGTNHSFFDFPPTPEGRVSPHAWIDPPPRANASANIMRPRLIPTKQRRLSFLSKHPGGTPERILPLG